MSAANLVVTIQSEAEWAWANSPGALGAIQAAKAKVDACVGCSVFWRQWAMQDFAYI